MNFEVMLDLLQQAVGEILSARYGKTVRVVIDVKSKNQSKKSAICSKSNKTDTK